MNKFKRYLFPLALLGSICAGVASEMAAGPAGLPAATPSETASSDTVIYPKDNYRARRVGDYTKVEIADSLLGGADTLIYEEEDFLDTLPKLTARDTIQAPDSLRETDPFRFKYYVAILDSAIHRLVSDSLKTDADSLMGLFLNAEDSIRLEFVADSVLAAFNLEEKHLLDSLYSSDSTARAYAKFQEWYNSLSPEERKKYDFEKKEQQKMHVRDSLDEIKAAKKAVKDSISKHTPRVLNTFAVDDTMHFQRIIAWTLDRDVQDLKTFVPDTGYNFHFYDYAFMREDVNATWLGVAASPVQTYNFFKRKNSGVSFWDPYETWSYSPDNLLQYNTKTPHTELAYWGTLLSTDSKESDNIHILSTQNITPATNFTILYERWGGNGMLINETYNDKTFSAAVNHLGENYLMNAAFIHTKILAGENGGILDVSEIRDTTLDAREVKVAMNGASSTNNKNTVYVDQQLRLPFNFINDIKMKRDTTFVPDSTAEIPTAFIGHALEYTTYQRLFNDKHNMDSLGQIRVDNKLYLRLQPFGSKAALSKIDLGLGDYYHGYHNVTKSDTSRFNENSIYAYAGLNGYLGKNFHWEAKTHQVFAGADAGNSDFSAGFEFRAYPFRKARTSPVTLYGKFSSNSLRPSFYERHMYSNVNELMRWDNDFLNVKTTRIEAGLDIPHWNISLDMGYASIYNPTYYDINGIIRQYTDKPLNILSANLHNEFVIADLVHLDNKLLAQYSSDQSVIPLPALAANLKWFVQFPVKEEVLNMQIGLNIWCNTKWYSPEWNFITSTFKTQNEEQYTNGPFFDVFINMQWKYATIFVKAQNLGEGWPMKQNDYFSAHRHIITSGGGTGIKFGIWWPFYTTTVQNKPLSR